MREDLLRIFPGQLRQALAIFSADSKGVQEIRMRVQAPLLIRLLGQEHFLTAAGEACKDPRNAYQVSRKDVRETLEYAASYSLYAYEEELRQGFLTIQGGHRIGVAGKTVAEGNRIRAMKAVSSLNIRLAHEVKGCADLALPLICHEGELYDTLIISPPCCGKTTLLRDLVRQVSDGWGKMEGMSVGVVDERSELGACFQGIPQNDLGIRTDILDCCPKAEGMMMLIRSMSPRVVAVDEAGSEAELEAMRYAMNCGSRVLATVHGTSMQDVKKKPGFCRLFEEGRFQRYIVLGNGRKAGEILAIHDAGGRRLYPRGGEDVN